ncbi:lipoprotein [Kaustia mangrovi]|uniref:Lipoprotein n=1 Tax=Kaustia mangrovi TaxID=2593653 RepID=A0A7S8C2U3_9HYPH|nr:lipoprotein [Kaustia mangrovi]QPC42317.1 lipoprotein [Kaustia mangrovi]
MRQTGIIAFLIALGLAVASCGVRGDLDPPPGADQQKPDEPFILDPVIQ